MSKVTDPTCDTCRLAASSYWQCPNLLLYQSSNFKMLSDIFELIQIIQKIFFLKKKKTKLKNNKCVSLALEVDQHTYSG